MNKKRKQFEIISVGPVDVSNEGDKEPFGSKAPSSSFLEEEDSIVVNLRVRASQAKADEYAIRDREIKRVEEEIKRVHESFAKNVPQ